MHYSNIDPEIEKFVEENIFSFITHDILLFFHVNPYTIATADNIANGLGRYGSDIEKELERLADRGILKRAKGTMEERTIYSYSPTSDFERIMEKYSREMKDRVTRLMIVSRILEKESGR